MPGALSDIRVIEFAGIGAAPFGAMMLADAGARAGVFF
jgi:crotonobetainyl-CoA:carnitine CoA-transferase CaiB-like acyl-CoA transferase